MFRLESMLRRLRRSLDPALPRRSGRLRARRIECLSRQHLGRAGEEKHGVYRRAVKAVQIQSRDIVVRVCEDLVGFHQLGLVVALVDALAVGAGCGGELAAVDGEGLED